MTLQFALGFNPTCFVGCSGPESVDMVVHGSHISAERPHSNNSAYRGYWNSERQALRFRCPDPNHVWRSIAQGLKLQEGLRTPVTRAKVGTHLANAYPDRSVLYLVVLAETQVFINLRTESGELRWHELGLRAENLDPKIWDPATYLQVNGTVEPPRSVGQEGSVIGMEANKVGIMAAGAGMLTAMQETVVFESGEALWRSAATQVTKTARDLLFVSLKKAMPKQRLVLAQLAKVLATPIGEAGFGYLLGVAMELKASATDVRRRRLARELRITGEATAFNVVLNPVREFLTTGIDGILLSIPELDKLTASLPEGTTEPARFVESVREPVEATR